MATTISEVTRRHGLAGAAARSAQAAGAAPEEVLVAGMNDAFQAAACFAALTVVVALLFRRAR